MIEEGGAPVVPSNGRGAVLVLLAFFVFSATDAIVKIMAGTIPAPQVTFFITVAALVLLLGHAIATGRLHRLVPRQPSLAFWRALLLAVDTLLIHYAFAKLPLAEAYLIAFLTPILVAMLGFVFLGERLSRIGWAGVLIGFAGVVVALKPGVAPLNLGHLAAFASAVFFALSLILLRRAKMAETDAALVASLLIVMTPVALAVAAVATDMVPLDLPDYDSRWRAAHSCWAATRCWCARSGSAKPRSWPRSSTARSSGAVSMVFSSSQRPLNRTRCSVPRSSSCRAGSS